MAKMKELTVQMANKPGTLAALGQALGKAKINLLAFMTDEAAGQSQARLVADNPAKATKALAGLNLQVSQGEVIGVALPNRPGALADAAGKLASVGININHGYSGTEAGSKKQLVIFAVSDLKEALKVLK